MLGWCLVFSSTVLVALAPTEPVDDLQPQIDPEPKAFLSAWADSQYAAACTHLDGLKPEQTAYLKAHPEVRQLAASARARCVSEALAQQDLATAQRHIQAMVVLDVDEPLEAAQRKLAGWKALQAARRGAVEQAVGFADDLPSPLWPQGLDAELLSGALQALRDRELVVASGALRVLEAKSPEVFGLDELRTSLWWATEGGRVAFFIALGAFLLLLALTARSLLQTRRRAKALLQAESGM